MSDENDNSKELPVDSPSAKILLSVLLKEYGYELDRGKQLETRTGVFLAFSGAILVFIASNVKSSNIVPKTLFQILPLYVFVLIFLVITLICLLGSIICFIKVITTKTNLRLGLDSFSIENVKKTTSYSEEESALVLITKYKKLIEHSTSVNDERVKWYERGINFILPAVIFTVLTYTLLTFNF